MKTQLEIKINEFNLRENMRKLSIIYDGSCLWTKKNASGVHITEILENLADSHNVLLFAPKTEDCMLFMS